jgi:hypothetical protein
LAKQASSGGRSGKRKADQVDEVYDLLVRQKESADESLRVLSELMPAVSKTLAAASDLRNHTQGFYEEVDKLAKGKAMLEVTDRALEEVNSIVSDTKHLVDDDPYLKRTNQFVAAGNNPVYPDVLLALRAVLQSLERFQMKQSVERSRYANLLNELKTIVCAIDIKLQGEESVSKELLERKLGESPSTKWIVKISYNEWYFDFERLESAGPPIVQHAQKHQLALGSGE